MLKGYKMEDIMEGRGWDKLCAASEGKLNEYRYGDRSYVYSSGPVNYS